MQPSLCINCGNEVESSYCPACGQKNPPKKISILNLYTDFQSRVYGFDGMFPQTLRDLTIRPGKVAIDYINGNRVKYVGPVGYFFVMLTIFILLLGILDIDFFEYSQGENPFKATTQEQVKGIQIMMDIFSNNLRILQFITIPITAFWLKVFFRKSGYSYLEMMVPSFYFYGHLQLLAIGNEFFYYFSGKTLNSFFIPLNVIYFSFASMNMFGKGVGNFMKGILAYVITFLTFMILVAIFVFVLVFTDPELKELIRPH